jgi:amino acid transporter
VFDTGLSGTLMGAALIFVAYEGFELIPNSVKEMADPKKTLPRAIYIAIGSVVVLYVLVALVAVGNLPGAQLVHSKEYALAVAARPALGQAGFALITIAALLSTASAINATLFGTARLGAVMATERDLPKMFSLREKRVDVPWASLIALGAVTLVFVNIGSLTAIASVSSLIFLTIFLLVNLCNVRLHWNTTSSALISALGAAFCLIALLVLGIYLFFHSRTSFFLALGLYATVAILAGLFTKEVRERSVAGSPKGVS